MNRNRIRKCEECGKEIKVEGQKRLNAQNVFCSKECESKYKKRQREQDESYFNCICPICNKPFHLKPYMLKKYKIHYCSRECHRQAKKEYMKGSKNHQFGLTGSKNASWKSDKKITNYGYIKIRAENHPYKDVDGFVFEHRLIAEKYLLNEENSIEINGKKYLKKEYIVHHIDRNKKNNELSNLQVMLLSEHTKLHSKARNSKSVSQYNEKGEFIKTYTSIKEAGRINKICPQNICRCCKEKQKMASGYIWKYAE